MSSGKYPPSDLNWGECPIQMENCPRCGHALMNVKFSITHISYGYQIIERVCSLNPNYSDLEKGSHFAISYEYRYSYKNCFLIFKERDTLLQNFDWRYLYREGRNTQKNTLMLTGRPFENYTDVPNYIIACWWQPKDQTLYNRPIEFLKKIQVLKNLE